MPKLFHPDGLGCSFGGKEYKAGADRGVEVPDEAVPTLVESHGFKPEPPPLPPPPEKPKKAK